MIFPRSCKRLGSSGTHRVKDLVLKRTTSLIMVALFAHEADDISDHGDPPCSRGRDTGPSSELNSSTCFQPRYELPLSFMHPCSDPNEDMLPRLESETWKYMKASSYLRTSCYVHHSISPRRSRHHGVKDA